MVQEVHVEVAAVSQERDQSVASAQTQEYMATFRGLISLRRSAIRIVTV